MSGINAKLLSAACALCLAFAAVQPAQADTLVIVETPSTTYRTPSWGIGLMLGEPTGLSIKRYLGRDALHLYLGGAYGPGLRVGVDYLFGLAQLHDGRNASVDLFVGVGGFAGAGAMSANESASRSLGGAAGGSTAHTGNAAAIAAPRNMTIRCMVIPV